MYYWLLLRVELDDELFANVQVDLITLRKCKHAALKFLDVNFKPSRNLNSLIANEGALNNEHILSLGSYRNEIARTHTVRWNVYTVTIYIDVAMANLLTSLCARLCKTKAINNVIQARLQDAEKVLTGNAGLAVSHIIIMTELLF